MKKILSLKKINFILFVAEVFALCLTVSGCKKSEEERKNEVVVYTYNSFSGEWGAGPEIARLFTQKTGISVIYADCGDSAQILSKAILEKENPYADVLIGIDNNLAQEAEKSEVLLEYQPKPAISGAISKDLELQLGGNWLLSPYDYSRFCFIFNSNWAKGQLPAPKSLEELTKDIYKKKIILIDSKTSTMGLGFEDWLHSVYQTPEDYSNFISRLMPSVLTVAPGWSIGYGMFTDGEAPLVFSYTTSAAYHVQNGEGDQFKALKFDDGHVMQVEGAGIVKGAKNLKGAKLFLDFLLDEQAQSIIPTTQWMFPANSNVELPASFAVAF